VKKMKRMVFVFILVITVMCAANAQALIIDLPDVGGQGFFKDLSTGFVWMDVDNFFGMSYTEINNSLLSSVFHIASLTEINQLKLSAPANPSLYALHASIMGGSSSRNLLWGYYDDDGASGNGGGWNYKWGSNPYSQPTNVWLTPIGSGTNVVYLDLGGWVVDSTLPEAPPVPEPMTLALLASGLASSVLVRKRK
jgi:opacity protein-like surface antigen